MEGVGKKTPFPHAISKLSAEEDLLLSKAYEGERVGYVKVGPDEYFLSAKYERDAEEYYNIEVRPSDTWLVTFPRSGTTLTQEMIWLIDNDLDFETAAKISLHLRFPFLEVGSLFCDELLEELAEKLRDNERLSGLLKNVATPVGETLSETPGKRYIKTHLPFNLLPENLLESGAKVVYVARNPKDVATSYFHLAKSHRAFAFQGDFKSFWNHFENNQVQWCPYWSHLKEGWKNRHRKNVLFMFYEDVVKDMPAAAGRVAEFLGKDLSLDQKRVLGDHLLMDNFKRNKSINNEDWKSYSVLDNSGWNLVGFEKEGGWDVYYDEELRGRVDRWIAKNLEGCDLKFPIRL